MASLFILLFLLLSVSGARSQESIFHSVLKYYEKFKLHSASFHQAPDLLDEYDFVVVGAGSGGCVMANRLTERPGWTVLLLEAGADESPVTDVPLLVTYVLATTGTGYNWGYTTEPDAAFCRSMEGGRCSWHRGKGVGGTSILNFMLYTRGTKRDYDDWARMGHAGWSYDEVLPYFKKSENIDVDQLVDSPFHGRHGYMNVERPKWRTPLGELFQEALRNEGYPVKDASDPDPVGVFPVLSMTRKGARLSASKAFIRPISTRTNLHIAKMAHVTKILIDTTTNRTLGVEFVRNKKRSVVRARNEVILSAGALNSPQLMMLSGIGPREHLQELGIPVVQDLPVGHNLQDHVSMAGLAFEVNDTVTLVESRFLQPRYLVDYLNGSGPYTSPGGAEATAFVRTKYADLRTGQPDVELVLAAGCLTGDTGGSLGKTLGLRRDVTQKMYGDRLGRDGFGVVPILLQPRSRGRVMLRSTNPFHWPLLHPNYFQDPHDVHVLVEGIKMAVHIGESGPFQRYRSRLLRRRVPGCEAQTFASDDYWECVARHFTTNLHHQVGTCAMGSVVDSRLRVLGLSGLRVVDASVMPKIPSAHTNAVVIMVGEKAADMVKQEWAS